MDTYFNIYIAGVVQGSLEGAVLDQGYRSVLTKLLREHFQNGLIFDPLEGHENSITYGDDAAKAMLQALLRYCRRSVDFMVVYLPEASMGCALEMECASNRAFIVVITPLSTNWVVRYYADLIVSSIEEFHDKLLDGTIQQMFESHIANRRYDIYDVVDGLVAGRGYYREAWLDEDHYGRKCVLYSDIHPEGLGEPFLQIIYIEDGRIVDIPATIDEEDLDAKDWIEVMNANAYMDMLLEEAKGSEQG